MASAVQPDEIEEFYTRKPELNVTQIEKHYYLVITLAGYGILACVALRSGSRNVKQPEDMVYWFDRLVELGIGTAEQEQELRARVWKVSLLNPCLAQPVSKLSLHCMLTRSCRAHH